jgi:hypothetical protein
LNANALEANFVNYPTVSVALLCTRDLRILGEGFVRCFPMPSDHPFDGLLGELAGLEASHFENGIVLTLPARA